MNYSAQNHGETDFSMPEKSQGFNNFLLEAGTVRWSRMKCCQAPVQNMTVNIIVHPNMLLQLCLQKTSLSQEVLKEQHGAGEHPTMDLHLWKCPDFYNLSC